MKRGYYSKVSRNKRVSLVIEDAKKPLSSFGEDLKIAKNNKKELKKLKEKIEKLNTQNEDIAKKTVYAVGALHSLAYNILEDLKEHKKTISDSVLDKLEKTAGDLQKNEKIIVDEVDYVEKEAILKRQGEISGFLKEMRKLQEKIQLDPEEEDECRRFGW